jgi:hypothetical protein
VQNTLILVNGAGNGGAGNRISFNVGSATPFIQSLVDGANSNSGAALVFATPSSGTTGTERMRITSAGNVGIGTSSPTNPLQVETTGADLGIQIYRNVASDGGSAPLFISHKSTAGTIKTVDIEAIGSGDMLFRTGATGLATFGSERMRITSSGSVVFSTINTNAPIARNGLYFYENTSLVNNHTAIVLLLGTYSYATYKIDVVVSIGDNMETTATFLVDIRETTIQSTILGGFATTNLAIISETSPVGTDTKFNFILNAQTNNSYLAIRNRRGGDRRAYIKIECISAR